jgi:DNA/RNA endonuclease YhcR with UshA esterase domain
VITSVKNTTYGNVYVRDWSGETYVYGIGAKGDFEAAGLKAGDVVTLVGKRGEYKGDPQMAGAVLESVIPVTPVSIDEFLDKEDNAGVYYMLTGNITEIANPTYGNLYLDDGTNTVYVYGCYPGWGATGDNRKNCLETKDITVGDKLSVIGVKSTYNGTPQLANGIYFSHKKAQ